MCVNYIFLRNSNFASHFYKKKSTYLYFQFIYSKIINSMLFIAEYDLKIGNRNRKRWLVSSFFQNHYNIKSDYYEILI